MGLFTKTIEVTKNTYIPYEKEITINENRPPTDQSIKLLNEFEEKARKNIIYKAKISQNHLNCMAIYYQDDLINNRIHFHVKFELNDSQFLISDYVDGFQWRPELAKLYNGFGNEIIFKAVHKKLSEMIAYHLMKQCPDFIKSLKK